MINTKAYLTRSGVVLTLLSLAFACESSSNDSPGSSTGGVGTGGVGVGGAVPGGGGKSSQHPAGGGLAVGGTSTGGFTAGGTSAGGTSSGGAAAGGVSAGGVSAGGTSVGGAMAGGASAGGSTAGGVSAGGASAGGTSAGGAAQVLTPPTVVFSSPLNGASGVAIRGNASVTFSEAMDSASLTSSSFYLSSGMPAVQIPGVVTYANSKAVFWPSSPLPTRTVVTATLTAAVKSAAGTPLVTNFSWTFTTGDVLAPGLPVNLGTAQGYAVLAKSGIAAVPTVAVTGSLGLSPAAASYITGFSLTADSTGTFSTSPQVVGKIYAADYQPSTPFNLTTAIGDMQIAYAAAAARAPDVTELGAGNIGGLSLSPGVYNWSTGLLIPTDVVLNGSATGVWIFQVAKNLTLSSGAKVVLAGGAVPKNVFWQVSGYADLGTAAHGEGVILTQTAITLHTGASVNGRLLAQTAVSLDASTVIEPAP